MLKKILIPRKTPLSGKRLSEGFPSCVLFLFILVSQTNCSNSASNPNLEFPGHNIIVISVDTLRADALGIYGEKNPTSPELDALAKESIRFERTLSQSCVTAPSHMSLLTSLYPTVHQVDNWSFVVKEQGSEKYARKKLRATVPTLASVLSAAGYTTSAFVGGGNLCQELGFDQGFEVFDDSPDNGMNGNREMLFEPERALAWIEENKDRKFFAFLHTYIPHGPYLPPPPWDTAFDPDYEGVIPSNHEEFYAQTGKSYKQRALSYWASVDKNDPREIDHLKAQYKGDVRYADDSLLRIFSALKDQGLFDDTIIVILSDHGEEFLEHGNLEHKKQLYEELVRVPLLIRLPGGQRGGAIIENPVGLIDVTPTLLDLVQVDLPAPMQGTSLRPLLLGQSRHDPIISEKILDWKVSQNDGGKLQWHPQSVLRSLRQGDFTYILRSSESGFQEELYDRKNDPGELEDVIQEEGHVERLKRFRADLAAHTKACRKMAKKFAGNKSATLTQDTINQLDALGYNE